MTHRVTLIPGDGVGPELSEATRRVLEATGVGFDWDVQEAGADVMERYGTPLPDHVLGSIRATGVAIKGPITTPVGTGFRSVNVALRRELDLYACLRPCKSYAGVRSRYEGVDLVIVRENTEDLYAGIEFARGSEGALQMRRLVEDLNAGRLREDTGVGVKPISVFGTERIVRFAFELARTRPRRRVTTAHKANLLKHTDGLWLEVAREVAAGYSDVEYEERTVDTLCTQLVQIPERFDVIALANLYGDLVSDLGAGLTGGVGLAPSVHIGTEGGLFETAHGSAPALAGRDRANPMAQLLAGMHLLRHLGEAAAAARLEAAIAAVIAEGRHVTADMKPRRDDPGAAGTRAVADAVIARLEG
jgi:isocitrate dehydrogenase (NAD+)